MRHHPERGAASLMMLLLLLVMVLTTAALLETLSRVHRSVAREQASVQALYLAESGIQVALHRLVHGGGYTGEAETPLGKGSFTVQVRRRSPLEVVATGEMPCGDVLVVRRSVRVRAVVSGGRFRIEHWSEVPSPPRPGDSSSRAFQRRTP